MGAILVPTGVALPLSLQLFDGDSGKFPRAFIYDASSFAVVGSPVDLAHQANGLYLSNTATPPDGRYHVVYIVYEDAGHTLESAVHTREAEYFHVSPLFAQVQHIDTEAYRIPIIEDKIDNIAIDTSSASIAAAVWNANKSAYDINGTFGWCNSGDMTQDRAELIDNLSLLDVVVSSRATQADMLSGFNLGAKDLTVAKQALLSTVDTKLGTPSVTISDDIAGVKSDTFLILDAVNVSGVLVDLSHRIDIAERVWDVTLALHVAAGTTGEKLDSLGASAVITPADITSIVDAVWDEPMGAHLTAGTSGAYQNLIPSISSLVVGLDSRLTPARAAKLDNLDVAVSTRESESAANTRSLTELAAIAAAQATINAIDTIVNSISVRVGSPINGTLAQDLATINSDTDYIQGKVAGLPADPASQSAVLAAFVPVTADLTTINAKATAIKAKTDNLPVDPASQTAVLAIPTNPLLTTDTRLNRLDVAVSTRATPADLALLATTSGLSAVQTAIQNDIANVLSALVPKATTAQVNAAVAPLATQILLQATKTAVDNLALSALTAAQVWAHTPRTLTDPVDVNLDISGLATAAQLAAVQTAIVAALPKRECQMGVSINPDTDQLEAEVWMIEDGSVLTDRTACTVSAYDADGNLKFSVGPVGSPSPQGVFKIIYNGISAVLEKNKAYVAVITISKGADVKTSVKSFTVF